MPRSADPRETLRYFETRIDALVALLIELVGLETPTGNFRASRAFVSRYRALLEECGLVCREFETSIGVHLVADRIPQERQGAATPSRPDVTIALHSDTVWPLGETRARPPTVRDGKVFGPGVYDMKAGLVQTVGLFRFLRDVGGGEGRHIRVFISADEEHGSVDARSFVESEVPPGGFAIVPEPPLPDGSIKVGRKGVGIYSLEIRGRAAHAGTDPHLGVSAIDEFVHQAIALHALRDPSRSITINLGTVHGGTASNVIPDRLKVSIDTRFERLEDGEEIDRRLRSLQAQNPEAELRLGGGIIFPPMVPVERTFLEAERARGVARELGLDVGTGRSGGGSDGSFLAARGAITLDGLGVDGAGAHSLREHVVVDRIPLRTALFTEVALRIGE